MTERTGGYASRREILKWGTGMAGAAAVSSALPVSLRAAMTPRPRQGQQAAPAGDKVAQMREEMTKIPLETKQLRDNIYLLYGPGGNMVALTGTAGKILVDTSVSSVSPKLIAALAAIDNAPLRLVINTHWHLDHTDGNANMHQAGATIIAHENTLKRLSVPQDIAAFQLHVPASAPAALPRRTFTDRFTLYYDDEQLDLGYIQPAHTDSDIYVHYAKNNLLHCGDVFFNGNYPFIDASTGGSINGMIAGVETCIALTDSNSIVIPGHGPVGDKASLLKSHDMLITVRDRVQAQKQAGKTLEEVVAAKPTADLDPVWGKGMPPDLFTSIVYSTL
jgi:cyclase